MDGIINVLKHAGVSSHDIVHQLRKILKTKKVGHTGTLDPDAIGVLPVCIGKATRLVEYLTSSTKRYRALMCFGCETDTLDGSGQILKNTPVPEQTREEVEQVLQKFIGPIEQIPPMYSAIKINGQPLYKLAREGKEIQRQARKIEIYNLHLVSYNTESALIDITCSKGTYIRTLCQDIGRALKSSAYMSFLLRIESGKFHIKNAYTLDEIRQLEHNKYLINMNDVLVDWPSISFPEKDITKIGNGNTVKLTVQPVQKGEKYKVLTEEAELLAIGVIQDNYFKPEKVFR